MWPCCKDVLAFSRGRKNENVVFAKKRTINRTKNRLKNMKTGHSEIRKLSPTWQTGKLSPTWPLAMNGTDPGKRFKEVWTGGQVLKKVFRGGSTGKTGGQTVQKGQVFDRKPTNHRSDPQYQGPLRFRTETGTGAKNMYKKRKKLKAGRKTGKSETWQLPKQENRKNSINAT